MTRIQCQDHVNPGQDIRFPVEFIICKFLRIHSQIRVFRSGQFVDKKIRVTGRIYAMLILMMVGIVVFDSFKHTLPFYYILYGIAGYIAGYFIWLSQRIVLAEERQILSPEVHPIGKVITLLLLIIRYLAGKVILEQFNIIWITDALYLIFIGIYLAKIKNIFRQIDEQLYAYFFLSKDSYFKRKKEPGDQDDDL